MLRVLPAIIIVLVFGVLSGCQQGRQDPETDAFFSLTDGLGRSVSLSRSPVRVVSIAPGATQIVRAAGGLSSLIGLTTADYEARDVAHLPRLSALPLDFEGIVALDPDLILASDQVNDPSHAELFDALEIPIIYLGSDTWDDVHESIRLVGQVLETSDAALMAADSLQASLDELEAVMASIEHRPTAIFLISHVRSYSFGQGSYVLDLMRWANMEPLTEEFESPAPVLDDEWVLLRNPDIIVGSFGPEFTIDDLLEHHPTWQTLDAVREGRIISVPASLILTPGPDNIRAAWHMARLAHPNRFPEGLEPSP